MSESRPPPPMREQQQKRTPDCTAPMDPQPDHGEKNYRGSGWFTGKIALVTGSDSRRT